MPSYIFGWPQPFSGIPGFVDVKFKDKIITVMVDHSFIETDSHWILKLFGKEAWFSIPQQDVGTTSDFNIISKSGGHNMRIRKNVYFKNVVFPGTPNKRPLVELVVEEVPL